MTDLVTIEPPARLKSFVGPWTRKEHQLLLACGKCQRKLKHEDDEHGLSRLKKALKARAKLAGVEMPVRVITTSCLKVCPKKGVAVCTQEQMGQGRGSCVRTVADLDQLIAECRVETVK
jgi:hypothetical protein